MKNKDMKKRILALILCLVMVAGICGSAFAEELDASNSINAENSADSEPDNTDVDENAEEVVDDEVSETLDDIQDVDDADNKDAEDVVADPGTEEIVDEGKADEAVVLADLTEEEELVVTNVWEVEIPALTSVYADDLIAIAKSQLGCATEDDSAVFISACMTKAQIPVSRIPQADNVTDWMAALSDEECDLYVPATISADEYEPWPGDLIFLDTDEEEGADTVGIISAAGSTVKVLTLADGIVTELEYTDYEAFVGYGLMPINMGDEEAVTYEEPVCEHNLTVGIGYPDVTYDTTGGSSSTGESGFVMDKSVNEGIEGTDTFELILDAYALGKSQTYQVGVPLDIVLVLDRSGSMVGPLYFMSVDKSELQKGCTYYDYNYDNAPENCIMRTDKFTYWTKNYYGYYVETPDKITYCDKCDEWVKTVVRDKLVTDEEGNKTIETTTTYEVVDIETTQLYEPNLQATERSLKKFLAMVEAHGEAFGVEHRVAVVNYVGNATYLYSGSNTINMTSASSTNKNYATALKSVDTQFGTIKNAITKYSTYTCFYGNTPTHLGMKVARNILENNPVADGDTRQQMVVLFADGAPGDGYDLYSNWGNIAYRDAQAIKDAGGDVYVIGLYDDADASDFDLNMDPSAWGDTEITGTYNQRNMTEYAEEMYYSVSNRYFNLLSSNFELVLKSDEGITDENLQYYGSLDTSLEAIESTTGSNTNGYFYGVQTSEALEQAFADVGSKLKTETNTIDMDERTILSDEISKYFELDCDCQDGNHTCATVKVYTADYTGTGNEFEELVEVTPESGITATIEDVDHDNNSATPNKQTIKVTGFDYAENHVIVGQEGGKKLVVKIQIETQEGFWGGNNVPTNVHETSAINYYDNNGDLKLYNYFPMPEVNVPLHINIEALAKTIYFANAVTPNDLLGDITAGYKTTAGEIVGHKTNGDPIYVDASKELLVTVEADGTLTPAQAWMDDYAKLTLTQPTSVNNRDCADDYPFTVSMSAIYDGQSNRQTTYTGNMAGAAVEEPKTVTDYGEVHILVPVVTFKDSVINFGFIPDFEYYESTNRIEGVEWIEINGHESYPAVDETTKPTLEYAYDAGDSNFVEDTPIQVTVSYKDRTDVTSKEITNVTTFKWFCDVDEDSNYKHNIIYHQDSENIITPHKGDTTDYEFWIHLEEPYELPSTGGPGIYLYLFAGVALLMGSSTIVYRRRCKEVLRRR